MNRQMEAGFAEIRREFGRVNDRLDSLYRFLIRAMFGFGLGILGVLAAFMLQQ